MLAQSHPATRRIPSFPRDFAGESWHLEIAGAGRKPGLAVGICDMKQDADRTGVRRGFTLVEMLVVIAIIAILLMMLVPMLGPAMERARQTRCGSNMSECFKVVLQYANDNSGRLPPGYAVNPSQLVSNPTNGLPMFVERLNLQGTMWYCPSLVRQQPKDRGVQKWVYPVRSKANASPFNIGYLYVGAPEGDVTKFLVPIVSSSADLSTSVAMLADICSAPSTEPTGRTVPSGKWTLFPHAGVGKEQVSKVCLGDGGVVTRAKDELKRSFSAAVGTYYW